MQKKSLIKERYYSLDIFRGATVAFMIMVNNPGSWDQIYAPLDHAAWVGCTPTDLVFPFFLFAVGNAMAFVMPSLQKGGTTFFLQKVIKRTLLIFLTGLFLNWCPFLMWQDNTLVFKPWEWTTSDGVVHGVRILGVLQRIAFCYLFASLILYFFKRKTVIALSVLLLLGYWILCFVFGHTADPYSLQGYFGTDIDKFVLGQAHMYHGEGVAFDPEGIASTLPAIVQVIIGFFAGTYIQQKCKTYDMLSHLLVTGFILFIAGYAWGLAFPVSKKIWTSSYVLYTGGLALLTLSTFIFLVEFKQMRGAWSRFFDVFGKNPLFIFVLSGFLPRVLALVRIKNGLDNNGFPVYITPFAWFYENVCKNVSADLRNGSLLYAVCLIIFYWLICFFLDKRKIYIRV